MKKGQKYPAETLTTDEIESILGACTNDSLGLRNRAMLYVLWRAGLRVSELLALRPCDISDTIRVRHGKGDKARTVGLDSEAVAIVGQWLERRKSLGLDGRTTLFCTLQGKPLKTNAIRELLKRLCAKAGIVKRVTPHTWRHTFASNAARQLPVHYVQQALGHSSLDTTARYISNIGGAAVDAVRSLEW